MQKMGLLRRVSQAAAVTPEELANSDGGLHIPAPTHLEPTFMRSAEGLQRGATSGIRGKNAVHREEAVETSSSLKPGGDRQASNSETAALGRKASQV